MNASGFLSGLFNSWRNHKDDRVKLQHAYLVLAFLGLIVSGLVSLLNHTLGRRLSVVSLAALGIFLANGLVWSILNSTFLQRPQLEPIQPEPNTLARTATRRRK